MDERLRKLKRAIVDNETAARYVAECVRLGENTRKRVKAAADLQNPIALLLETPRKTKWPWDFIDDSWALLTTDELIQLRILLGLKNDNLQSQLSRYRTNYYGAYGPNMFAAGTQEEYFRRVEIQKEVISKLLLKLT